MPLGYTQFWGTSKELHCAYLTDFRTVRIQSWCDIDSVLVQYGAFMQLLVKWHNIFSSLYSC